MKNTLKMGVHRTSDVRVGIDRTEKGITLIALVITIVVLLILVGISLRLVIGETGITQRSINAKKTHNIAGAKEKVELDVANYASDFYHEKYVNVSVGDSTSLQTYIIGKFASKYGENHTYEEDFSLTVDSEHNQITVRSNTNADKTTSATATIEPDGKVVWEATTYGDSGSGGNGGSGGNEPAVQEDLIDKTGTTSYVGCYADVDGNGTVDGIIYVDLIAQSGESGVWSPDSDYAENNTYTISTVENPSNLNDYIISEENVVDSRFDNTSRNVVKLATGSTRSDAKSRFYVMGLEDITDGNNNDTLYWYYEAYSNGMEDYTDENGGSPTSIYFGTGKANTATMKTKWDDEAYGEQNSRDIWGNIGTQISNGWFVPSKEEWCTFGKAFSITDSNYTNYNLSYFYWASSQFNSDYAWGAYFSDGGGYMYDDDYVNDNYYVRLSTTF